MKIVIINDFLLQGGTEVQCIREKEILESYGHEVYLITLDKNFSNVIDNVKPNINIININTSSNYFVEKYNISFYNFFLYMKVRKVLKRINPDVIHANNLNQYPFTLYRALKGYKVIQTIRDYSSVCIKATCIFNDNSICSGFYGSDCIGKCKSGFSKSKFNALWHMYKFKKMQLIRFKYVSKFISPSMMLKKYLLDNEYKNVFCINDCFDLSVINNIEKRIDIDYKKYFYFGNVNEIKGIFKFINVFNSFSKDKKVQLVIAGKALNKDLDLINSYVKENINIKYIGFLNYQDILKELSTSYAVVVPSLWMENYPNTVLEAMASKCLVLGSDRGGIPEMIAERGLIYNIIDDESILKVLEESYKMPKKIYNELTMKSYKYVEENNSINKYYKSLIDLFNN